EIPYRARHGIWIGPHPRREDNVESVARLDGSNMRGPGPPDAIGPLLDAETAIDRIAFAGGDGLLGAQELVQEVAAGFFGNGRTENADFGRDASAGQQAYEIGLCIFD